ncbi:peptidylprolyl isomerase [Tabrizicola sp.]|jgi:peptidyl-prolyl cis-trans isomerase SurA|uniref:peptidylprolyl isomerase n=1 Tax=Tabrizicola sp. TaxID=2005166 RepID=UPI0025F70F5C|nr:peptidylprolyl isomerase [Tabrizicola sp.]MBY0352094.1 peptidylprolyl isomerase [Tabrizicola sp.]MDK2775454.1 peptidylprolyl isomerase [Tabrizicola sp.]
MGLSVLKRQAAVIALGLALTAPVLAQDLFGPRLYVNDRVITNYEIGQRALFLRVLRAPGNPEVEALKALTEDRLRQTEAERLGLKLTDEELKQGLAEFASRANLSVDEFVAELDKAGIASETFRDFVAAGLLWRQAVRARFLGQVPVSENDVDRALEASVRPRALQVLASELVIPAPEGQEAAAMTQAQELSDSLGSEAAFADAARQYSASATAGSGGRLDWLPLANLPAAIGQKILALAPGEVSDPIAVPGAVVLFLLRDVATDKTAKPIAVNVEWAEFLVPDDAAEIARIRAASDDCNDLYGLAKGLPQDRLTVTKGGLESLPGDVALELARLDPGETSVALTRGGFRRMLMLCGREQVLDPQPTRDQIREQITNQKLEGLAEGYLEELRAAAIIREP